MDQKVIGSINVVDRTISIQNADPISYQCTITGNCCRSHQVPILDYEVEKLRSKGHEQFLEDIPGIDTPEGKTYYLKRDNGVCEFLKKNRCSIHKYKPFSCRLYPFNIIPTEVKGEFNIIVPITNTCPEVKETKDRGKAENSRYLNYVLHEVLREAEERNHFHS